MGNSPSEFEKQYSGYNSHYSESDLEYHSQYINKYFTSKYSNLSKTNLGNGTYKVILNIHCHRCMNCAHHCCKHTHYFDKYGETLGHTADEAAQKWFNKALRCINNDNLKQCREWFSNAYMLASRSSKAETSAKNNRTALDLAIEAKQLFDSHEYQEAEAKYQQAIDVCSTDQQIESFLTRKRNEVKDAADRIRVNIDEASNLWNFYSTAENDDISDDNNSCNLGLTGENDDISDDNNSCNLGWTSKNDDISDDNNSCNLGMTSENDDISDNNNSCNLSLTSENYDISDDKNSCNLSLTIKNDDISNGNNSWNLGLTAENDDTSDVNNAWNLGWTAENDDRSDDAITYFQEAKKGFEELLSLNPTSTKYQGYNVMANLKIDGNNSFNYGLYIQEQGQNLHKEAKTLFNVQKYQESKTKYEEALDKFNEARQCFLEGSLVDIRFNSCIEVVDECINEVNTAINKIYVDSVSLRFHQSADFVNTNLGDNACSKIYSGGILNDHRIGNHQVNI